MLKKSPCAEEVNCVHEGKFRTSWTAYKVIVIYTISLSLILHALHLFVATGIGTTGLGIGRALAIDIVTHALA